MSKWTDPSEKLGSSGELTTLQKEIEQLQQENKVLHIRAQGVQVLGKVLQDSQENNAKLQQEVQQLKSYLAEKGIDSALADLSLCTSVNDDSQSNTGEQDNSYHLPTLRSTDNHDYNVNVTTVSGPQSFSAGYPSLLPGDFHIKEIQAEFQHITSELDQQMRYAQKLRETVEKLPGNERDTELQGKLTRLFSKLNEYIKEARTRETLSSALVSEEEKMKSKLVAMEAEQASHENVVQQLKDKIDKSKEEMEQIQDEVKFFEETVLVARDQESGMAVYNEPLSVGSQRSTSRSTSDESIIIKTPLSRTGSEACESCGQYQRQLDELQKQLLLTKAEKDEALKLKEEILDVNHKWDAQYKMLMSASSKEIADLKNQLEILRSTGLLGSPVTTDRKALDDRCKQLENELQQKKLEVNQLKLVMRNQSTPMYQQPSPAQHASMEQPSSHLSLLGAAAPRPSTPTQSLSSWPGTAAYGQQIPPELIDQIEVLKQQLRVYADDFATEREDRERNQTEKEKLKEELDVVKEQLQALEQQAQIYEEDFKREKREKESLQQQLRAVNTGGLYQYQDPLASRARAVAEQQARVQAIKEVHDRERDRLLRGQQELQQQVYGGQQQYSRIQSQYNPYGRSGLDYTTPEWQRQNNYPLLPRGSGSAHGPIAHPANQRSTTANSIYHGGEVLPDTVEDVVDSPSNAKDSEASGGDGDTDDKVVGLEECPRCLRKFDGDDNDAILKHIERCIS